MRSLLFCRRRWLPLFAAACLAGGVLEAQIPSVFKGKEEKLPKAVAAQPVPFSHQKHAKAGMSCLDCHADATREERAGLPAAETCMLCHTTIATDRPGIQKLVEMHQSGAALPWVRVYEVPDFVFFSHASHLKAGEECSTCHGAVETRDVLAKEVSTSMTACMNCHAAREASNECILCHQLGH